MMNQLIPLTKLLPVSCIAALAAAAHIAGAAEPQGAYKPLPRGTVLDYGSWKCSVGTDPDPVADHHAAFEDRIRGLQHRAPMTHPRVAAETLPPAPSFHADVEAQRTGRRGEKVIERQRSGIAGVA